MAEPGAPTNPLPPDTSKAEPKVKAATGAGGAGAVAGAFIVWLLETYVFKGDVPGPVTALVYVVVPGALAAAGAWVGGYTARHQYRFRPDEVGLPPREGTGRHEALP